MNKKGLFGLTQIIAIIIVVIVVFLVVSLVSGQTGIIKSMIPNWLLNIAEDKPPESKDCSFAQSFAYYIQNCKKGDGCTCSIELSRLGSTDFNVYMDGGTDIVVKQGNCEEIKFKGNLQTTYNSYKDLLSDPNEPRTAMSIKPVGSKWLLYFYKDILFTQDDGEYTLDKDKLNIMDGRIYTEGNWKTNPNDYPNCGVEDIPKKLVVTGEVCPKSFKGSAQMPPQTQTSNFAKYKNSIEYYGQENNIPPAMIAAVIAQESDMGMNKQNGLANCNNGDPSLRQDDESQIGCISKELAAGYQGFSNYNNNDKYKACRISQKTQEQVWKCVLSKYNNMGTNYANLVYDQYYNYQNYMCSQDYNKPQTTTSITTQTTVTPQSCPVKPLFKPVPAQVIVTSKFGMRNGKMHEGVDYGAASKTPVIAAAAGTVITAGWEDTDHTAKCGLYMQVDHGNNVHTTYCHLDSIASGIQVGSQVAQKQLIAYSGNTGKSTGPHLHFMLVENGQPMDPIPCLT